MATTLVTGGAGFIGSHLVRRLLEAGHDVRVLDNLATGKSRNLEGLPVDVIDGDICSPADLKQSMVGVTTVFHVAALPSVERSWKDPVATLAANAHGTLNVLEAARGGGVDRVVYSSSSSVYGDQASAVKTENLDARPISPYGYSKFLGEKLALAFATSRLRVLALRYFNVFGARQDPHSPYAAVIPRFIRHALAGTTATVNGDGTQSRDFTHVDNVVDANLLAARSGASGLAMNIACGKSHSVLDLVAEISALNGKALSVTFGPPREGDIQHSLADITLARAAIGYEPTVTFKEGLRRVYESYRND